MSEKLVLVNAGNGLCLWATWDEWLALVKGVDLEAARAHAAPLELETESNPPREEA